MGSMRQQTEEMKKLLDMDPVVLTRARFIDLLNREFSEGMQRMRAMLNGPSQVLLDRIDRLEAFYDKDEKLDEDRKLSILNALGLMRSASANIREKGGEQFAKLTRQIGLGVKHRAKSEDDIDEDDLEIPA